jgi:hypothetical protein
MAFEMLLQHSPALEDFLNDEHRDLGEAIMKAQVMDKSVSRDEDVLKRRPGVTWGVLEGESWPTPASRHIRLISFLRWTCGCIRYEMISCTQFDKPETWA